VYGGISVATCKLKNTWAETEAFKFGKWHFWRCGVFKVLGAWELGSLTGMFVLRVCYGFVTWNKIYQGMSETINAGSRCGP
jgi:hypothetical protein